MNQTTLNAGESTGTRDPRMGKPMLCTPGLRVAAYPDGSHTVESLPDCRVLSEHDTFNEALIGLRVAWMARTTPAHREDGAGCA